MDSDLKSKKNLAQRKNGCGPKISPYGGLAQCGNQPKVVLKPKGLFWPPETKEVLNRSSCLAFSEMVFGFKISFHQQSFDSLPAMLVNWKSLWQKEAEIGFEDCSIMMSVWSNSGLIQGLAKKHDQIPLSDSRTRGPPSHLYFSASVCGSSPGHCPVVHHLSPSICSKWLQGTTRFLSSTEDLLQGSKPSLGRSADLQVFPLLRPGRLQSPYPAISAPSAV
nr:hypothetical protein Iba_chr15fCG3100 [Ipomoea batatas]